MLLLGLLVVVALVLSLPPLLQKALCHQWTRC